MASVAEVEYRSEGEPQMIRGHAAIFYDGTPGTEFDLWDGAVERIMPSAFDRALAEIDDVRALFNHREDNILGRVSAGTLAVTKDAAGLMFEVKLGATTIARDVAEFIRRGDITGSSFSFSLAADDQTWKKEDGLDVREIHGVTRLFDVGPVTFPAFEATDVVVREARDSHHSWAVERLIEGAEFSRGKRIAAARARLRVIELDMAARV